MNKRQFIQTTHHLLQHSAHSKPKYLPQNSVRNRHFSYASSHSALMHHIETFFLHHSFQNTKPILHVNPASAVVFGMNAAVLVAALTAHKWSTCSSGQNARRMHEIILHRLLHKHARSSESHEKPNHPSLPPYFSFLIQLFPPHIPLSPIFPPTSPSAQGHSLLKLSCSSSSSSTKPASRPRQLNPSRPNPNAPPPTQSTRTIC